MPGIEKYKDTFQRLLDENRQDSQDFVKAMISRFPRRFPEGRLMSTEPMPDYYKVDWNNVPDAFKILNDEIGDRAINLRNMMSTFGRRFSPRELTKLLRQVPVSSRREDEGMPSISKYFLREEIFHPPVPEESTEL